MTALLPSIRRGLLIRMLATALIPLVLAGALSMTLWLRHLKNNAFEDAEHIALNAVTQIEGRLLSTESSLRTLASILESSAFYEQSGKQVLNDTLRASPSMEAVYHVDHSQRIIAIGLPPQLEVRREDYIGSDLSRLQILQRAQTFGKPQWSDSHLSLITGRPCLTYALPFRDGILVCNTSLASFEGIPYLADLNTYTTLLLDNNGTVLLDNSGKRPSKNIRLDHEPLIAKARGGQLSNGNLSWEGEECLGSVRQIPQTGWLVVSFARSDEVLDTLRSMLGLDAISLLLGLLLASLLAVAMTRRLTQPLAALSQKTSEIAAGDYDAVIDPQPYRELDQVASSLRSMGRVIREREQRQRAIEAELQQSQKLESMGRLVGGIAHDFNNILHGIRGFSDLAKGELVSEDPIQDHLSEIQTACGRASELVRQLLIFSRRDNPVPSHMDLNSVLPQALRMLRRLIGEQVLVNFTPAPRPAWILADKTQVEQVLMNLAVNARDAMPEGGNLLFQIALLPCKAPGSDPARECVELSVTDTGHGMTPDIMARIFDPFFTTKEVGKGTGLGLATVYGIMQRSGGRIEVESQPGKGTRFRLQFPLNIPPELPASTAAPNTNSEKPARPTEADVTILVAEDDVIVRTLLGNILRTQGFQTLITSDGAQAIEHFDRFSQKISLVLLDVIMPRKSGKEVAEHIWSHRPDMPVLFTSGYFTDTLDPRNLPPERAQILRKPYGNEELLQRVRELLSKRTGP